MASISSKRIIVGAVCLAFLNISLMPFSLSPTHMDRTSGPLTEMKFASDSFAAAFARRVFPQPGGPYRRIALDGLMPILSNASGYLSGHSTASLREFFTSSRPPMSFHLTSGTSTKTSLSADGPTLFIASTKSLLSTLRASRISPGISSFSRSIFGRIFFSAFMAASLEREARSAPTKPCVEPAISFRFTSFVRGMPLV